jgi:ATP synthase protein I
MGDERKDPSKEPEPAFVRLVGSKAARKLRVQLQGKQNVWMGLGMSGLIGWSVTVPTVLGAMAGLWWDRRHSGAHSWTLMLLLTGLIIGCANAWHWLAHEEKSLHDALEAKDE